MCQIIPFPSADLRRAIRSRRLRIVLAIAKREGFVYLNNQERNLIHNLRQLSPEDRQFVCRAAASLPPNQPAQEKTHD